MYIENAFQNTRISKYFIQHSLQYIHSRKLHYILLELIKKVNKLTTTIITISNIPSLITMS